MSSVFRYLRSCMCFSIQVDKDLKRLAREFGATESKLDFKAFNSLMKLQAESTLEDFEKLLGLKHHSRRKMPVLKQADDDGRIFSNYFANIIVPKDSKRLIEPMRYRVRPNGSKTEIPTKYNVFNARLDSLEIRDTWKSIFMKNHGLIPFIRFYEWVESNGSKKLISFSPDSFELMWSPCIWDEWKDKSGKIFFKSFAIITDDPPAEIESMGHYRCPIFLNKSDIDIWLNPNIYDKEKIYSILKNKTEAHYSYKLSP